ncbi:unnamed protein product [Adineta ricciae]|uniref:Dynein regulatory complex protein 9 n=1 Tax=Adineta ricciae TaxID=249248 RepID=A0A814YLJ1_ADIRI|nr:unnamed protein product [Adineta ricciae]
MNVILDISSTEVSLLAYELATISEDAFDQLDIIRNDHQLRLLTLSSILNDNQSLSYLPSVQVNKLNIRLDESQNQIKHLIFRQKHFQPDNPQHITQLNQTKFQLTNQLMEEKVRSKIALRYCNDWKTNHILQWIQMLLHIEGTYTRTIHQYEIVLQHTELAHQETIKTLIRQNNELKLNSRKWYDYYQNETYRFDRELNQFRHEYHQLQRQRQEMHDEYERMKIIVDEYHQMKLDAKILFELQKQREEAIRRIQAWWRGTIVRHLRSKRKKKR